MATKGKLLTDASKLELLTLYELHLGESQLLDALYLGSFSGLTGKFADLLIDTPKLGPRYYAIPHEDIRSARKIDGLHGMMPELFADDLMEGEEYWVKDELGRHRCTLLEMGVHGGVLIVQMQINKTLTRRHHLGEVYPFAAKEVRFWPVAK